MKKKGGYGVFGMEFFIKGDEVYFNEFHRNHMILDINIKNSEYSQFDLSFKAI